QLPNGVVLTDAFVQRRVEQQRLQPILARFRPIIHGSNPSNVTLQCLSLSTPLTIKDHPTTAYPQNEWRDRLNRQTAWPAGGISDGTRQTSVNRWRREAFLDACASGR